MAVYSFQIADVNIALFNEELTAALGRAVPFQVMRDGGTPPVITFGEDALNAGEEGIVHGVVTMHDPTQLASEQAAALDAAARKDDALKVLALADPDKLAAQAAEADSLLALRAVVLDIAGMLRAFLALVEAH